MVALRTRESLSLLPLCRALRRHRANWELRTVKRQTYQCLLLAAPYQRPLWVMRVSLSIVIAREASAANSTASAVSEAVHAYPACVSAMVARMMILKKRFKQGQSRRECWMRASVRDAIVRRTTARRITAYAIMVVSSAIQTCVTAAIAIIMKARLHHPEKVRVQVASKRNSHQQVSKCKKMYMHFPSINEWSRSYCTL